MAAIVTRTLHGVATDKVLRLTNNEALRQMQIGTNWQTICIGVRFRWLTNLNPGSGAKFVVGVCSGNQNGFGSLSFGHVVGIRTKASSWNIYNSSGRYWVANASGSYGYAVPFVKVGGTVTDITSPAAYYPGGYGSRIRLGDPDGNADTDFGWFVHFTKGSPNWTVGLMVPGQSTSGVEGTYFTWHELTSAKLRLALEQGDINSARSYLSTSYWYESHSNPVPVNESTNGILDSVCLHWNMAANEVEVSEIAVAKWA